MHRLCFNRIIFTLLTCAFTTASCAESNVQTQCKGNLKQRVVSVPGTFANDFANEESWPHPKEDTQFEAGKVEWTQLRILGSQSSQFSTIDMATHWEHNTDGTSNLTIEGYLPGTGDKTTVVMRAKLKNTTWPTGNNLNIDEIAVNDAIIKNTSGERNASGKLTNVKLNQDFLWISGSFKLDLKENQHNGASLDYEQEQITGEFRGNFVPHCSFNTQKCSPYHQVLEAYQHSIYAPAPAECADHIVLHGE